MFKSALIAIISLFPPLLHGVEDRASKSDEYLDTTLPHEVPVLPYEGERYDAEVPDTVELTDNANWAINMATRLWDSNLGYEQLFGIHMKVNPPILEYGHGGLLNCGPKVLEALPMLRVMTGSTVNIDVDGKAMGSLLINTGKDGLCYQPVEGRPWAFYEETTKKIQKPYCDIFGEGRQLLAYARWYEHDHNPLWKSLAERKIEKLLSMTLKKEDNTLFFRLSRGYTPWDLSPTQGDIVPIGDHVVYAPSQGMVGSPAAYIVGWMPQAGEIWRQIASDVDIQRLADGMARYLYNHGQLIDPQTGRNLIDNETHFTHSLLSQLLWALASGDKSMAEWARRGYEWNMENSDPNRIGIIHKEPCTVSDMIGLGVVLSRAGMGDYWDNVDLWVRNTFLIMQVTDVAQTRRIPISHPKKLEPSFVQPPDAAERCVGVWAGLLDHPQTGSGGCCYGNCARILYYLWDGILTDDGKSLKVNLLFNRASAWADINSWVPCEGKVTVRMKVARNALLIRIPDWVKDKSAVTGEVNGREVAGRWEGGYFNLGGTSAGDKIVVRFPISTRELKDIKIYNKDTKKTWTCDISLRGSTVVEMSPDAGYPLYRQEKFKADQAPMRKLTRFVSSEHFLQ